MRLVLILLNRPKFCSAMEFTKKLYLLRYVLMVATVFVTITANAQTVDSSIVEDTALPDTATFAISTDVVPVSNPVIKKNRSSVLGNAAAKVFLTETTEGCQPGSEGVAIQNIGESVAIAYIEMTVTSGATLIYGHSNIKRIQIDNLSPNEVRFIGCRGCKGNQSGKVCTSYKLLGANFK